MVMRLMFVLSFALFAILAAVLTMNWWTVIPAEWWPLRFGAVAVGVAMFAWSMVMTFVAAFSRYRR
jgi:membrane protein YdbS with pleckstrin-like domain